MEIISNFEIEIVNFMSIIHNFVLNSIMIFISTTGNSGIIWIIFGLILTITKKYRKCGLAVLSSLILCLLIGNLILKPSIARIRPFDLDTSITLLIAPPRDFSFPSGHTLAAFAASFASISSKNKLIYIPAIIYAFLMAFSRLYLQVHFPTDIIFGMVIGICFAIITNKFIENFKKNTSL